MKIIKIWSVTFKCKSILLGAGSSKNNARKDESAECRENTVKDGNLLQPGETTAIVL